MCYSIIIIYRAPDPDAKDAKIPIEELPKCGNCQGLTRPHVIWFGESLDSDVMARTFEELDKCDLCLLVRHIILWCNFEWLCENWSYGLC